MQELGSKGYLNDEYASECLATLKYLSGKPTPAIDSKSPADCLRVFGSHSAENEPCRSDYDCTDEGASFKTYKCVLSNGAFVCRTGFSGSASSGAACSDAICEQGTYCDTTNSTCKLKAEGDSCETLADACSSSTYCSGANGSRTCKAISKADGPCSEDRACGAERFCVGGVCQDSFSLSPSSKECEALAANPLLGAF